MLSLVIPSQQQRLLVPTHLLDLGLSPLLGRLEAREELPPGPRLVETKLLEVLTELGELLDDGIHLELDSDGHDQPCEPWRREGDACGLSLSGVVYMLVASPADL